MASRAACNLLILFMILSFAAASAAAPAPSLELKLDQPQDLPAAGPGFRVGGEYTQGPDGKLGLGLGKDFGPAIQAAPFCGEAGTITFTLSYVEPEPDNRMRNRHLVTLRLASRGFLGFYFIQTDRHLQMAYKQLPESIRQITPAALEAGRAYRAAATWDGRTVCFYLDGKLVGEMKQGFPATYPAYARLNLGPYRDGWTSAAPWQANDVFIRDLKVWKEALSPVEIADDAGVEAVTAEARYPTFLAVPRAAAPTMDGKLDDPAWQNAASFVSLLDSVNPAKSLSYPDNRPLLCHDGESLYVGFETLFPTGARLVPGQKRAAVEPEVWPDESFEFHIDVAGKLYRFAGNATGGYCESLDSGSEYSGRWEYVSALEFRIDNRHHWQGEIRIPFATIGVTDPLAQDLKINFCRTWRCFDQVGITQLQANSQNYGDRAHFVTIRPVAAAEGGVFTGSSDPSFGDFTQRLALHSARGGDFSYTLRALNTSGDGQSLVEKKITLQPAGRTDVTITTPINAASAQRLLFQLDGPGGELLLRQVVPFRLSEDYLEVTPVFGAGEVLLKPRYTMLKSKYPSVVPSIRLLGPGGGVLRQITVDSDEPQRLPFDRQNPAGTYVAELISGQGDEAKVYSARKFQYTGPATWEKQPLPDIVPAPFEPLRASQAGRTVSVDVWGRKYRFHGSLLPSAIETQGRALLSAPAEFSIGGTPVKPERLVLKSQSPVRAEVTASRKTAEYELSQEAWVEYDGVFFNRIEVRAARDLGAVTLSLPLPEQTARFLHATASGFGGGGRQNLWLDRNQELPFYPSVWVGNEEAGVAWFAESASGWTTRAPRPIKIIRDGKQTRLEVTFADRVAAGATFAVEFGLLATPVKPLPGNYPLNLFADGHSVHLNQPAPARPVVGSGVVSWEGAGFFDLPMGEANPEVWQWLQKNFAHFEQHGSVFTPYTASMLIPGEYAEAASRIAEWQMVPASHLTYTRDGKTNPWYWTCSASEAGDFFATKFDRLLDKIPLKGIYLDFGSAFRCNNALHGCHDRYPLLAQRRLYQRLAASFVRHGIKDYVITVHNSESVQWPTFTHATHFLNGEGLRQMSSTTFHNGKDLQDTYTRLDFASEHSSLPFGITSSVYVPVDPLLKQFGGGVEDPELYRFRMTKAALAGTLVHNTIPSPSRTHYGWYDKIVRIYDKFDVPAAEFLPYWRNQSLLRVLKGKDIFVSLHRSRTRPEILAIISHISPEHLDQDVEVEFDPAAVGLQEWTGAEELLTAPDPDYERLYAEKNRIRMPIKLADFGVEDVRLAGKVVSLRLKFHSVAVVKLTGGR
ncbi:MAG: glycoside hydrolase domain-containing protein [Armatimonadota bacterium]